MSKMPFTRRSSRRRGRAFRHGMVFLGPICAATLAGCVEGAIAPHVPAPPADATPLYWELRNDHRAVTLSRTAPYDTLRIRAVPLDGAGRPLSLEGTLTWQSSQPGRVEVSPDGLIRAVATGTNTYIISTFIAGNVRHVDTTVVNVTALASPPAVASFSVQPVAPDSARWVIYEANMALFPGYDKRLPLRIQDAAGKPITGVAVRYTSSAPEVSPPPNVPIHSFTGAIRAMRVGRVTFFAEATIYGTKWQDSVEFEIDWPVLRQVPIGNGAAPGEPPRLSTTETSMRIGKGGTVMFVNVSGIDFGIDFDDPSHVEQRTTLGCPILPDAGGSGNIAPFGGGPLNPFLNCRSRRFPVPGVYTFRTTPAGVIGTIVVEESAR